MNLYRNNLTIGDIPQLDVVVPSFFSKTGLVSYYKLDGNSNDAHGSNNGTDTSISYSAGKIGNGANFNGSTSEIVTPLLTSARDNVTLSCWVKLNSLSQNSIIFGNGNPGSNGFFLSISNGSGSTGSNLVGFCGGIAFLNTGYSFPSTGVWYHIMMIRDSGTWRIYLNNSQKGSTWSTTPNIPSGNGMIGDSGFNGSIDEVGIWNRALTSDEITQLYNNGNGLTY